MKREEVLFGSSLIICAGCLLYLEGLALIILFAENGNLFNVVASILRIDPLFNAITEVLSYEFNVYISLLMIISFIGCAILIESAEEEEE